ncbi:MAG: phage BR0599 family protein [Endozoicomonas sp.]
MINPVDASTDNAAPVELYEFTQGLKSWYFTDSETEVVFQSKPYIPVPLSRSEVVQDEDLFRAELKVSFPRDNEFAQQFIGFAPDLPTTLSVYRGGYPNGPFDFYWKGRVVSGRADGSEVTLECESVFTSMRRPGLRARYERVCRHVLYGEGCRVNQQKYKVTDIVQSMQRGVELTMTGVTAGLPEGHFTGGIAQTEDGSMRFITGHKGTGIVLVRPFHSLSAGDKLLVFPGCDHSLQTCRNKFNNLDNFGGFPYIPTKNPFDGSSIV